MKRKNKRYSTTVYHRQYHRVYHNNIRASIQFVVIIAVFHAAATVVTHPEIDNIFLVRRQRSPRSSCGIYYNLYYYTTVVVYSSSDGFRGQHNLVQWSLEVIVYKSYWSPPVHLEGNTKLYTILSFLLSISVLH